MGEAQGTLFEPEFNRSIKVQTFSQKITSHAGALLLRETDHQLGLVESLALEIHDPAMRMATWNRPGENVRFCGRGIAWSRALAGSWLHVEESVSSFWKVLARQIGQLRLASQWSSPHGTRRRDWVPPPPHSHLSLVLRG